MLIIIHLIPAIYVVNINSDDNTITVGPKNSLFINKIELRDVNFLSTKEELKKTVNIKVRSTGKLLNANVKLINNKTVVEILGEETGISPGQACVIYSKDEIDEKISKLTKFF